MTTTLAARRLPPAFTPSQPSDEGYLNRSLLDNIDAQGDAEPVSSDSEAAGASATTFGSLSTASSVGSPSIPYHISMQAHIGPRADSPNHHAFVNQLKSAQHNSDIFTHGSQNNTTHSMYNSINSIGLPTPDYSLSSTEPDALNFSSKANGSFAPAPFRTSTSFNAFPNRSRHPNSFRDNSTTFSAPAYPTSNDLFGATQNPISHLPPSQPQPALPHGLDSHQHSGRPFDFAPGGPQLNGNSANGVSQSKQLFGHVDPFRQGLESTPTLLQKQQSVSGGQLLLPNGQGMPLSHQSPFQASYTNGLGSHSLAHNHHTQPQFVSHGSASGPGQGTQGGTATGAPTMNHTNGSAPNSQTQEEISTIFVVGFPDDMSVRNGLILVSM